MFLDFWKSRHYATVHIDVCTQKKNEGKELTKLLKIWSRQKHYVLAEILGSLNFNFLPEVLLASASCHFSQLYTFKACSTSKYTILRGKEAELLNKTV